VRRAAPIEGYPRPFKTQCLWTSPSDFPSCERIPRHWSHPHGEFCDGSSRALFHNELQHVDVPRDLSSCTAAQQRSNSPRFSSLCSSCLCGERYLPDWRRFPVAKCRAFDSTPANPHFVGAQPPAKMRSRASMTERILSKQCRHPTAQRNPSIRRKSECSSRPCPAHPHSQSVILARLAPSLFNLRRRCARTVQPAGEPGTPTCDVAHPEKRNPNTPNHDATTFFQA
jgi:hypothetical protein